MLKRKKNTFYTMAVQKITIRTHSIRINKDVTICMASTYSVELPTWLLYTKHFFFVLIDKTKNCERILEEKGGK